MKIPKRHIATSTDANYLHKAVVFYKSLRKVHNNFLLHIYCFDDITFRVLKKLNYKNVRVYHPSEFETKELLKVKKSKEKRYEYYWACNPFLIRKTLLTIKADFVSGADCDLMFFQSPEFLFDELKGADVLIQPNNFSFESSGVSPKIGYYCTSFQSFRKNKNALKILNWWHRRAMEWCAADFANGKFGEQKYLDNWRTRFKKVREIANPVANVAPWNIQKFDVSKKSGQVVINNKWPLVYYHYHALRMNLSTGNYIITGDRENTYPINKEVIRIIYDPYTAALKSALKELKKIKEYRDYVSANPRGIQITFSGKKDIVYAKA